MQSVFPVGRGGTGHIAAPVLQQRAISNGIRANRKGKARPIFCFRAPFGELVAIGYTAWLSFA
jgi:hypothetical protein